MLPVDGNGTGVLMRQRDCSETPEGLLRRSLGGGVSGIEGSILGSPFTMWLLDEDGGNNAASTRLQTYSDGAEQWILCTVCSRSRMYGSTSGAD